MNIDRLQDRISYGMGAAARKLGSPCTVYRPLGPVGPLRPHNKLIEVSVAFHPIGRDAGGVRAAFAWEATFDSHYTAEGDYLVGDQGTFFVAMQWPALPVKCILTNQVVTIVRPSFAAQGGYSGLCATGGAVVISQWPGHLDLATSASSSAKGPIVSTSGCLLLPKLPTSIEVADVITDEAGTSYIVQSAEQTATGWRVLTHSVTP